MVQSVRWVVGVALVLALAGMGTILIQGKGVSQEKPQGPEQDIQEIEKGLDLVLDDLEQLQDMQNQLDSMQRTLDSMEKRLIKMEKINLKTWDFVYKMRKPGGASPPETADMQDELTR